MHNGTCVKETDCPCVYQDKFYKQGEKVPVPGAHCTHMVCTIKGMKKVVDHECAAPELCKDGKVFQHCPCERTCHDDAHHCDKSQCVPACACPLHLVFNGEKCVEPKQCTCAEGNVTYADDHSWDVGQCTKCHCVQGRKQCAEICKLTEESCKKQGKKLFNKDLKDGVCCRCVSEEAHCVHNGEEKPIGAVWHKGLCETYTCTKTPQETGMITVTKQSCPTCAPGETKEYVANKCCAVCRKTTPTETAPKTKPTQKCSEVMEDHEDFVDLHVDLKPHRKGDEPSDLRPISGKGWSVLESSKPSVTLTLSTNEDTRPGQLEKLSVIGNVKSVVVHYTTAPHKHSGKHQHEQPEHQYKPYNKGQPIDVESGEIVLTPEDADSTKSGLVAYKVRITVVKAVKPELPLNLKLKVFACVEDIPEPCIDEEKSCAEILKLPGELVDKRFTLQPAGQVADLRSTGKGWTVSQTTKPVITVNLASSDGTKPGLLEKVVLKGNVKTVKVEYTLVHPADDHHNEHHDSAHASGFHDYNKGKPVTLTSAGELVFENERTHKSGILVRDVRITVLSAVDESKPYDIKMQAFACVLIEPIKCEDDNEPANSYSVHSNKELKELIMLEKELAAEDHAHEHARKHA